MVRLVRWLALALLIGATAEAKPGERWVAAWATSQQIPEPNNALPNDDMADATLRQVARIQIPASRIRVRFSNAFGTEPLRIDAATVARSADGATSKVDSATLKALRFGGAAAVIIPAGADYWSDAVDLPIPAGADLAISIHLPAAPTRQTGHPGSRATSYTLHGDHTGDAELTGAKAVVHWYQLAGIEAVSPRGSALVAFGDSITDGSGVQPDTNKRWTDALQLRLRASPALKDMAVLNAGIGGNRVLKDGLGPNALARFDRDVLTQPGVTHVILLEGVNDLGTLTRDAPVSAEVHAAQVAQMTDAYRQMVARARAHGIKVIGATILPFGASDYYHPGAETEADRQVINKWIRTPGNFDGVIDFDAVMRDPANLTRLRKDLDVGDGLHPSIAGYQKMADAVPLALLR